jgi:hypothetical protein
MRIAIRISATVAILSTIVLTGVLVYLQIGLATGQRWSSLDDTGPQWPFGVFVLSLILSIFSFAAFVAFQIQNGKKHPWEGQNQ